MALVDNTPINLGSGGDSIRDIQRATGGPKTQVVQLDFGGANTNVESLVATGNGLPVTTAALGTIGATAPTTADLIAAVDGSGNARALQLSGSNLRVETVVQANAVDRGAIIGFSGAAWTTSAGNNTITLTTTPTLGAVSLGQIMIGGGVASGTYIYALLSGVLNTASSTYSVSSTPATMTAANSAAGFANAVITTASTTTIALTTVPTSGAITIGVGLVASGIPVGTTITALASGTINQTGSTYTISIAATATNATGVAANSTPVTATSVGPQVIMAANANRRGTSFANQNASANVWFNAVGAATADYHSLKLIAGAYYESPDHHSGTGTVAAITDTVGASIFAREF